MNNDNDVGNIWYGHKSVRGHGILVWKNLPSFWRLIKFLNLVLEERFMDIKDLFLIIAAPPTFGLIKILCSIHLW